MNEKNDLSSQWLGEGMRDRALELIKKGIRDLKRGAIDQTFEHTKRAGLLVQNAFFHPSSPRLSDDENAEYARLIGLKYKLHPSGTITSKKLHERQEIRLHYLDDKARGIMERPLE